MNENKKLVMDLGNSLKYVNSTSHIFNVKFLFSGNHTVNQEGGMVEVLVKFFYFMTVKHCFMRQAQQLREAKKHKNRSRLKHIRII